MIKYFVRSVEGRTFDYSPLEYETLIDTDHNSCLHYINTLDYIKDYDAVLMEDDLELCDNFQEEIEKVISQYPNTIINFFTMPVNFFTTHYSTAFAYNQCTYFPKGILYDIQPLMKKRYNACHGRYYGPILHRVLKEDLGIPHLIYRPALVQHKDVESILSKCKGMNRNTLYYKDYLDRLGIDLLDAVKPDNKKQLQEMLDADRTKWKEEVKTK